MESDSQLALTKKGVIHNMDDLNRVSKMLSQSGYFADARDAAQCGVKVLAGLEMGIGAFASMAGIHIIKGRPSVGANLMAAAVKRHPTYNYRVLEHSDQVCKIEFYELWGGKWESVGVSPFTIADAKKAGVQNLDKFPRNMLFARAMSNGVKWYCPDIFDTPTYTPEEMGESVDQDGNIINVEAVSADLTEDALPPQLDKSSTITEAQLKRYHAIAKQHGWSVDAQKAMLGHFKITSRAKIPADKYEEIIETLESSGLADQWAEYASQQTNAE